VDNFLQFKLLLALLLGAFIGLEREVHEMHEKKSVRHQAFLGIRTFTLTTMLGAIAGYTYSTVPLLFALITCSFFLLTLAYYFFDSYLTRDIGITTEIALLYSFIIGALITLNIFPLQLIVSIVIVLTLILSRKKIIMESIQKIEKAQLGSFISYLVLALVILPLLPNTPYSLSSIPQLTGLLQSFGLQFGNLVNIEIINPFKLWQIVALITGVDVFGYILERTLGQKGGWMLTSFAGGFISSTATTQSLAQQSKSAKSSNHLVSAAIVANLASFLQHALIILPISALLFAQSIPIIVCMIISSGLLTLYFLKKSKSVSTEKLQITKKQLKENTLFNLFPALKFALLFTLIKLFSQIALQVFGNNGFLISIGFGAIPGIDAVLISIAELSGKTLSYQTALWAFIFANFVNLFTKSIYCFVQGKKDFAVKFSVSAGIILASGVAGLLFRF
jgi:uncharacterized membrane protein (DUF4010 family)